MTADHREANKLPMTNQRSAFMEVAALLWELFKMWHRLRGFLEWWWSWILWRAMTLRHFFTHFQMLPSDCLNSATGHCQHCQHDQHMQHRQYFQHFQLCHFWKVFPFVFAFAINWVVCTMHINVIGYWQCTLVLFHQISLQCSFPFVILKMLNRFRFCHSCDF